MSDLYRQYLGSIIRSLLMLLSGYLVTRHMMQAPASDTLLNMLTGNIVNALPGVAAQAWSMLQKWYQLKVAHTALEAAPGTDMEVIKSRVIDGRGAALPALALLTAAVLSLNAAGCATLRPGPGGYTAEQVKTILTDAKFGLGEACSQEWVPADTCKIIDDGLDAGKAVAAKDQPGIVSAVLRILVDVENKLPADSRGRAYIDYIVKLFKGVVQQ